MVGVSRRGCQGGATGDSRTECGTVFAAAAIAGRLFDVEFQARLVRSDVLVRKPLVRPGTKNFASRDQAEIVRDLLFGLPFVPVLGVEVEVDVFARVGGYEVLV